jgi:hypothetical protein
MICAVVQDGVVVNMIVADGGDPAPDGCDLAEVVRQVDGKEVRAACNIGWQIADVALPEPAAEPVAEPVAEEPLVAGPSTPTVAGEPTEESLLPGPSTPTVAGAAELKP